MKRIAILDYGTGNLHSLAKALRADDIDVRIEADAASAARSDVLILPGVGAFGAAVDRIGASRAVLTSAILDGLPTLGICLGMQLLFDRSEEGPGAGLGVIRGDVRGLRATRLPQIGWNSVDEGNDPLLVDAPLPSVYYANGFVCSPTDLALVTAWSTHEADRFPAIVRSGAAVGVQFHPEKSSSAGVRFIRAFIDEALS